MNLRSRGVQRKSAPSGNSFGLDSPGAPGDLSLACLLAQIVGARVVDDSYTGTQRVRSTGAIDPQLPYLTQVSLPQSCHPRRHCMNFSSYGAGYVVHVAPGGGLVVQLWLACSVCLCVRVGQGRAREVGAQLFQRLQVVGRAVHGCMQVGITVCVNPEPICLEILQALRGNPGSKGDGP